MLEGPGNEVGSERSAIFYMTIMALPGFTER